MANDDSTGNKGLPIPYLTAVWSGMSSDDIAQGLKAGTIDSPPGSPAGWTPAATEASAALAQAQGEPRTASAGAMVDRSRVEGWLRGIDPALSGESLDAIWNRAGTSDAARAETLTAFLADALLGDVAADPATLDAFVADPSHRAQVVDLAGKTGADIAALAKDDVGYRQALVSMQPIALTGNRAIFAQANAHGALDRFDPDTGEQLITDAWVGDRAKLLAWKSEGSNDQAIAGTQDWTFVDHTTPDAQGQPAVFELATGAADAGKNQVVFGNDGDELLQGVAGSDRMYAGDGNDILRGGAGGDHLEGGRGDDLVLGGAGADELVGNQGDDELDGGRGNDHLAGNGGDDTLVGGRGNDRLEGGAGNDTYVIEDGDGTDTILDADGIGSIELDGASVAGTMSADGEGQWTSLDGGLAFAFSGNAAEPGTLTITSAPGQGDDPAAAGNVVQVKGWKNGDLGITLAGAPAASSAAGPTYHLSSISGPEVPLVSAAELDADDGALETGNDASVAATESRSEDASIAWGDVAPVGVGNGAYAGEGYATDAIATAGSSGDSSVDAASSSPSDSSLYDADFESALASIFGTDAAALSAVEPAHMESALQAFSGVLEAPDVTAGASASDGAYADAVTAYDYADAMAGDFAADDAGGEMGMMLQMPVVPEVRSSDCLIQTRTDRLGATS